MNTITNSLDISDYASAFGLAMTGIHSVTNIYTNGDNESWHSLDVVTVLCDSLDTVDANSRVSYPDFDDVCKHVSDSFRYPTTNAGASFERGASVSYVDSGYDARGHFYTFTVARSGGLDI